MVHAAWELHSYQHQCNMYRQLQHNQQFYRVADLSKSRQLSKSTQKCNSIYSTSSILWLVDKRSSMDGFNLDLIAEFFNWSNPKSSKSLNLFVSWPKSVKQLWNTNITNKLTQVLSKSQEVEILNDIWGFRSLQKCWKHIS